MVVFYDRGDLPRPRRVWSHGWLLKASIVCLASSARADDPSCWAQEGLTYEYCCTEEEGGNRACWNPLFVFERCCNGFGGKETHLERKAAEEEEKDDDVVQREKCGFGLYQQYKFEAAQYYTRNVTHWTFSQMQSMLVTEFEYHFRRCAAAALQALLIKLEQTYFREKNVFGQLHAVYTDRYHEAVARGLITKEHYDSGWHLRVGNERVASLRALGGGGARGARSTPHSEGNGEKTEEGGGNERATDLVICYCNEDLTWLAALWTTSGESDNASAVAIVKQWVNLRIIHKCPQLGETTEEARLRSDWASKFREMTTRALHFDPGVITFFNSIDAFFQSPLYDSSRTKI